MLRPPPVWFAVGRDGMTQRGRRRSGLTRAPAPACRRPAAQRRKLAGRQRAEPAAPGQDPRKSGPVPHRINTERQSGPGRAGHGGPAPTRSAPSAAAASYEQMERSLPPVPAERCPPDGLMNRGYSRRADRCKNLHRRRCFFFTTTARRRRRLFLVRSSDCTGCGSVGDGAKTGDQRASG